MGKKKSKEVGETTKTEVLPPSSDIFKTLFGEVAEQNATSSLFSDDNPFRRKPQDSTYESSKPSESPNVRPGIQGLTGLTRKERGKEKRIDSDLDSEAADSKKIKKLKKVRSSDLSSQLDVEAKEDNVGNTDMGEELIGLEKDKHKKKRKRDEIEREYEVRKYGVEENEEERPKGEVVGNKRKTLDNPADMMVSKEGFDDESKLLRTIFVGNLPLKIKKKTLLKEFKKFGEVESVRIRSVPISDTKTPRKGAILSKKINDAVDCVHAYIVFKSEESAQASLVYNMAVVEGNHIRVDRACPPRKKLKGDSGSLYDTKRTVFVGNLPFDVKDEELYQLFCGIPNLKSSVEAIRVIRDPNNSVGKGIAYVLLKNREAVNVVLKRKYLKLRERELRLSHTKSNPPPSAKPKSSTAPVTSTNTPSNKFASNSRPFSGSEDKPKRKLNMNYQGVKASKDNSAKKPKSQVAEIQNERQMKRPAVAARKAKAKLLKDGAPKQAGAKRKFDNRTPESSQYKKKVKKARM